MSDNAHAAVHNNALALLHSGRSETALDVLRNHLETHSNDGQGFSILGYAFIAEQQFGRALNAFHAAIKLGFDSVEQRVDMASLYLSLGHNDEVSANLAVAKTMDPSNPHVRLLEARTMLKDDPSAAVEAALDIAQDHPQFFDTYALLSGLYRTQFGDFRRAQACLDRAFALGPERLEVFEELANLYSDLGMVQSANLAAQDVLERAPHSQAGIVIKAISELAMGNFETGWAYYARRRAHAPNHATIRFGVEQAWSGEDLEGKTILAWTDQSVGDEILYGSMLPDLVSLNASVVLACEPRMVPTFERSFPAIRVVPDPFHTGGTSPKIDADCHICLPDLGPLFRPSIHSFPKRDRFLVSDIVKTEAFRSRYQQLEPQAKLVGISWRSIQKAFGDAKTSTLEDWAILLTRPGYTFVSVQYGDVREEVEAANKALGCNIIFDDQVDALTDMDAAMSQIAAMDLVVSTSNTAVHMAGSQGVPTKLVLPAGRKTVWYWGVHGSSIAFYESVEVYRNGAANRSPCPSFSDVLAEVAASLA